MSAPEIEAIEASGQRQHFTDVRHVNVRWEPYKKDGQRQRGTKGRWQEQVFSGDYWRWQNCRRPDFAHDPEANYTAADLERVVKAALEAAADKHDELWRENSATKSAAIRALDPAEIVRAAREGGE